jgi:hypothetical protein
MSSDFSADTSILGFKYQLRYALLLLFQAQRTSGLDVSIDIERIDDIDVRSDDRVTKLVQTKNTSTVLTNSSAPFWKTIRIWSEAIRRGKVTLSDIQTFELVATSTGPTDDTAIVRRLQHGDATQKQIALTEMRILAAANRTQATLGAAYLAFFSLLPDQQAALVEKITVTTEAPSFDELDELITRQIVHGPPDKRVAFSKVLFAHWDHLVECYLRSKSQTAIGWDVLQTLLHEISLQFEEDNLPTDFVGMLQEALPELSNDQRIFIQQLIEINANTSEKLRAQRTFLKASNLLAFWQRNLLVRPDEVTSHASRLIEECNIQHGVVIGNPLFASLTRKQIGLQVYLWALNTAPHLEACRIRRKCIDLDVIRGSFHALADRRKLGWHPDWSTRFAT